MMNSTVWDCYDSVEGIPYGMFVLIIMFALLWVITYRMTLDKTGFKVSAIELSSYIQSVCALLGFFVGSFAGVSSLAISNMMCERGEGTSIGTIIGALAIGIVLGSVCMIIVGNLLRDAFRGKNNGEAKWYMLVCVIIHCCIVGSYLGILQMKNIGWDFVMLLILLFVPICAAMSFILVLLLGWGRGRVVVEGVMVDLGFDVIQTWLLTVLILWWWGPIVACFVSVIVSEVIGGTVVDSVVGISIVIIWLGCVCVFNTLLLWCVWYCGANGANSGSNVIPLENVT